MDNQESDLHILRTLVRDLVARVERLERRAETRATVPSEPSMRSDTQPSAVLPAPSRPASSQVAATETPAIPSPANTFPARPLPPPRPGPRDTGPHFATAKPEIDLESRIGSHWLNRIGISAVLIGMSYFLKLAFDNNWIGPTGRVSIGLLAGIGAIIWSERFRTRGYNLFSYSLKAVGVGVLYLSLWAAFQVYALIPSPVAFLAMVIVTASTAMLAIKQDAEILAAIALAGGFSTPLLLSTGQNHEVELFSYVALLCAASVALVAVKPWRRLLILSYAGMLVLYVGWYSEFYRRPEFAVTL
ncbi:MAG TPA: DUF2339 domain-containing protein, partial [Terriglobales bacterium]|nr:DUF2339 domain-containing protein [Terriglobales bacterium]